MDDAELTRLLHDLESDRVERKSSLADREKILEAICAFANDLPGYGQPGVLFVGVRDDGSCAQLPITDELLLQLADLRSNGNILPFPQMTVEKRVLDGCPLAVVIVEPSDDPPVRLRGRTCIRVGPQRAIATRQEENRLAEKRRHKDLTFDLRPVSGATVADLDSLLFRQTYLPTAVAPEILAENQRTLEEQLGALRFIDAGGTPTVVGMLTVGQQPRQFLPGAYVQFLRLEGTELADPIKDQKELGGPIVELMRQLDELLRVHITIATDVTSQLVEVRQPSYPIAALRQLLANAVMHRTYENTNAPVRLHWFADRIEIQSPGGPFGIVSRTNFGRPGVADYRNAHLAEVMKNLGYVQRFGVGIALARRELEKNGNPPLEFQIEDQFVLVVIRSRT
jgi:ATP-dependent DNA helicase RecG